MNTVTSRTNNFSKSIWKVVLFTALVLLVPLVAMQFSNEVDWNAFDFIAIGSLLFGAGLVYEYIGYKLPNGERRILLRFVLFVLFLLAWAELAVGVFGTPFAGS